MAEILGKDLDKWDDSLAARQPFALKESDVSGPQYLTGSDFVRSAKISPEWKLPVNNQIPKVAQPIVTLGEAVVDTVVNYAPNLENLAAQRAIELTTGEEMPETLAGRLTKGTEIGRLQDDVARVLGLGMIGADALINRKEYEEKAKTYDEAVELVNNRDYPLTKYARRVLADTTNQVETRRVVRELYNQSRGIDSSAWYNQAGSIIGAMIPTIVVSRGVGATARAFGASRIGATNAALNATKGIVAGQMAGDYAEETAAEYLERTGDTTFENFTAKDATGLSAMAYGAIAGQIEVLGGIEPIMAGAVSKVGLRSGLLKAGAKVGLQEAVEEFLQGMAEFFTRKIDRSTEKTWGEAFKESLTGAVWGLFIGGPMGTGAFYINRRNLTKGIKKALPNISDTQATQVADAMIDNAAETSSQDPTLRNNLRDKVSMMYETSDIDNKEDTIDAITDLEYALIVADANFDGIDVEQHPLFQGEVNRLGWFRAGIPEESRTVVNDLLAELNDLETQLKTLNEAEEKDWAKIDEIERKLDMFDKYALDKLGKNAPASLREFDNELRKVENKYVQKEKQKYYDNYEATPEQKQKSSETASFLAKELNGSVIGGEAKERKHGSAYVNIDRPGMKSVKIRLGVTPINNRHKSVVANFNVERMTPEEILEKARELIADKYVRTNKKINVNFGFDETKAQPLFQDEVFKIADENARLDDIYPAYDGETIEVDGKERTVYNSEGQRIAKSKEALTNFWRWFGDSKVVDEQGRPLVVYHGTLERFNEFDTKRFNTGGGNLYGAGFYFSNNFESAEDYGANVVSVYLKVNNPFVVEKGDTISKSLSRKGVSKQEIIDKYGYAVEYGEEYPNSPSDIGYQKQIVSMGYDGIIVQHEFDNEYVALMSNQIKSVNNRGTYSPDTGNIYWQNRISGGAPSTYRGAYIPQYRFIQRTNKMDASTLSHELAHDWFETNFDKYRSGKASPEFMRAWGTLEKALGITEKSTKTEKNKASEAFARAYEGWIMDNKSWEKLINVDEKDKDEVIRLMQDYQNNLRDIYQDLTSPYFKQTWGKLGELKPELVQWFDRMVNITDLDVLAERGEISQEQANQEKLNRAIDTVIENTTDPEGKKQLEYARTLNDTQRYEVEGGNKNALQRRIGALAQAIDENNMLIKENYDTHRDMLEVAKQADNFVRTRLDDALAIINGQMAEQEGLFKEDIYTALERLALENGDLGLLDELRNSEIANRLAKELGQRVAGFRNWNAGEVDVFSAIKALDNKFNKALQNKNAQAQLNEAERMFEKAQKEQDKLADKNLESILNELRCK